MIRKRKKKRLNGRKGMTQNERASLNLIMSPLLCFKAGSNYLLSQLQSYNCDTNCVDW